MSGSDKSLLDRLSALKGGSPGVSLDRSSNALNVSLTGIEPPKPPSREDALSARLRSLRNTPEREVPPPPQLQSHTSKAVGHETAARGEAASLSPAGPRGFHPAAAPPQSQAPTDDVDPFLETDDQTLEDLLSDEDLGSQEQWNFDPKAESAKVNALLEELSKASPAQHVPDSTDDGNGGGKARDADDSDGEEMTKEVETLLSQALDDARLNTQPEDVPDPPSKHQGAADEAGEDQQGDGDPGFSLPSVPSTIAAPKSDKVHDDGSLPGLSLPSVPSGQPKHEDLDDDLAARMAALGGLGAPSEGGMGLPSVPTFQPADRAVKRLTSKAGYTDEDADTWCTVCLEDATLQCLGCEDVYCARCWHEMHVGPAAAFDDRTHKAVRFIKPKKDQQRRVALGAS
ncbi:Abscission/NoCut checkpoint regulator [Colletotrichum siamense]|uniref:Abscission/NoCut checkpoint regulator n=1 Tax=Colletotrichum siamense TaxID=690259 RepID=UPI001872FE49|nr:Abscission/NoCut checkpoint regulator [Colletotrichum siamense]KAF5492210.1 Abscission/NoCut checkpoint regulator [Colletotrichum siamense]